MPKQETIPQKKLIECGKHEFVFAIKGELIDQTNEGSLKDITCQLEGSKRSIIYAIAAEIKLDRNFREIVIKALAHAAEN